MVPEETFTVTGMYEQVRNPDRRWWQFWKRKMIDTDRPLKFTVSRTA